MTNVPCREAKTRLSWCGYWYFIWIVFVSTVSDAAILSYRDANGVLTFTNIPPQHVRGKPKDTKGVGSPHSPPFRTSLHSVMKHSDRLASKYGLNPHLVRAIIMVESNFQVEAVSRAGAQGLMQLMPETSRAYGVKDPFDPQENLEGGIRHLRDLMDLFAGNLSLVLAAYNAGVAAVEKFQGIPPFAETQAYVQKVLKLYRGNGRPVPQIFRYTNTEQNVVLLTDTPLYGDRREKLLLMPGRKE